MEGGREGEKEERREGGREGGGEEATYIYKENSAVHSLSIENIQELKN